MGSSPSTSHVFPLGSPRSNHVRFLLPSKRYLAGDTVSGEVEICISNPLIVNDLDLLFVGKESFKWSEKQGLITQFTIADSNEIINAHIPLVSYNGGQLEVGLHYVPFSFALPAQIPSSFYYKETL